VNTISAIETRYKGYRFRSRLEARWAMFYDLVGMPWTYETEPVSVHGEAYLPDFRLHFGAARLLVTHEVKSLHEWERIQPLRVYMAGKMKAPSNWRPGDFNCYSLDVADAEFPITAMHHAEFRYGGPFMVRDDHRGAHGPWVRHMAEGWCGPANGPDEPKNIVRFCFDLISKAHLVCAHIASADAYGTLVEIGYARALGIPVAVSVALDVSEKMRRQGWGTGHAEDDEEPGEHDLWFSQATALHSGLVDGDDAARKFHAGVIRAHTSREYRLISTLGQETKAAAMTFGDPLDVANKGTQHNWGVNIGLLCRGNREAAEQVRAHRFDRH
jgi:hypothetical protein